MRATRAILGAYRAHARPADAVTPTMMAMITRAEYGPA
jgi:hypothetical protein